MDPVGPTWEGGVWGEESCSLGYLQAADLKYSIQVQAASMDLLKCFNAGHRLTEVGSWIGK